MPDSARAIAPLLQGCGGTLVLQRVIAVPRHWELPVELIQQGDGETLLALVGWNHSPGVGNHSGLVLQLMLRAVVSAGEGPVRHHAVGLVGASLGVVRVVDLVGAVDLADEVGLVVQVVTHGVKRGVTGHHVVVAAAAG